LKILIAATPQPGHLNPVLAIARMAKGRADDVVATTAQALLIRQHTGWRFPTAQDKEELGVRARNGTIKYAFRPGTEAKCE
jgi:UDP:flavonoid glycosyltransferase YjiC (YdhE family)